METRLILATSEYEKDAEQALLFLSIFGLRWSQEVRDVDVSRRELYETKPSSSRKSVTSLRTDWILSLAPETCVVLVCDKVKSLQVGLNGQQGTINDRYAIEVYVDQRKGTDMLSGTSATICHEIMHALAEYHGVADTLHADLKTRTLEQCREILIERIVMKICGKTNLPEVVRLENMVVAHAKDVLKTPIKILERRRSPERQEELWKQRPKVTNARAWQSMHQFWIAFDYCFEGKKPFPPSGHPKWNAVNSYAKSIGLHSYGIDENFDDGHLELLFNYSEKQVMSRDIDWTRYWNAPVRPKFHRDLMNGSKGDDVLMLQRYLNQEGFTVSEDGPGSPGNETDWFGEKTRLALARFQEAKGISPALGYLGLITRKYIEEKG